jgi:hypothetical protein
MVLSKHNHVAMHASGWRANKFHKNMQLRIVAAISSAISDYTRNQRKQFPNFDTKII